MARNKKNLIKECHIGDEDFQILGDIKDTRGNHYYLIKVGDKIVVDGSSVDSEKKSYMSKLIEVPSDQYKALCEYIQKKVDIDNYSVFDFVKQ